jgi:hypothetical protein
VLSCCRGRDLPLFGGVPQSRRLRSRDALERRSRFARPRGGCGQALFRGRVSAGCYPGERMKTRVVC